jgi:cysteinyl-tRNA synthetase
MTVYDYCHIGHARVMVAFDYIIRFLRSQGWSVKYVRNITDIDDKIIKRANENGESITQLTDRFIQAMNEDAENLGCLHPDEAPRATDYIDQMQSMIGNLVEKGTAYPSANGDVYFQVEKFANMVVFQDVNWKICKRVHLNVLMLKLRKNIPLTLYFGNMPKKMNLHGLRRGAKVVRVGTLNVLPCRLAA